MTRQNTTSNPLARWAAYAAILIHIALAVPMFTLGLVAPGWAILVFYLIWGVLLFAGGRLLRTRPWLVVAAPLILIAIVFGTLILGDVLLGWTA